MHRMQLEGRTHEGFPFNTQPQNSHEARVSSKSLVEVIRWFYVLVCLNLW